MAYIRTVRTASGARAVQIVHSTRRGSKDIEHIGSAHTDEDYELLLTAARQRQAAGQGELDLGLDEPGSGGPLPITATRMEQLIGAIRRIYVDLGLQDSIDAHLTVVFAALAVARRLEHLTDWSLKKFITTTRRYKTITIRAGDHDITAADPLPNDLRDALDRIHQRQPADGAH